jgi:hypothetical protein
MTGIDWSTGYTEIPDPDNQAQTGTTNSAKSSNGFDPTARDPNWPRLDSAAYYGLAGEVIAKILPETEADPTALLLQYLTCFGNMVGRKPFVRLANVNHYPNIFTLIVGRTARSRKGTSAQDIRTIMENADFDWTRNNVKSGISSGEGIIEMVRDARFEMNKKTQTLECVDPGVADKRLLLDEREFSSALSKMKQDTNIISRVLREAWDCSPPVLSTRTKQKPSLATEPLISVVGHITLDELRQRLDKLSITDGFGNRFLYSCVDRSKLLSLGGNFDPTMVSELGMKTRMAVETAQTLERLTIAEEAKGLWKGIYAGIESVKLTSGLIDHLTARAAPQLIRLALLYALLDGSSQIAAPHITAAQALWQFCEASARYIFDNLSSDHVADTILRELEDIRPDGISRRDIIRDLFGGNIRVFEISQALKKLQDTGKARCQKQRRSGGGPGRPREMWFAV